MTRGFILSSFPHSACILNTGLERDMIGFVEDGVRGRVGGLPYLAGAGGRVPIAIIVSVFGVCEWWWRGGGGGDC